MRIVLNGEPASFPAGATLHDAAQGFGQGRELVRILNGYQTDAHLPLHEGDTVVVIEKGSYPPQDGLRAMLAARDTPKVAGLLARARVAVAGLGGLGSHVAVFLARAGVGCLHLIDCDTVEPSNLNRQAYRLSHLGLPKSEALKDELAEIAPYCRVISENVRVDETNVGALFADDPYVCEAFDAPSSKALLVNAVLERFPEKVVVAASGMAGHGSANAIVTRKIAGRFYLCGDGQSDARPGQGLMAPRVAVCAGHQALMLLRLIAGETAP